MTAMLCSVDTDDDILTLPAAADELGMAHVTLWRLARAGKIKTVDVGRVRGVTRSELERFRTLERPQGRPRKDKPAP